MKKKIVLATLLFFCSLNVFSQAPNWLWAQRAGGTSHDSGTSIATDALGNVYVTGLFESPTITFGSTTLTNVGMDDLFIVKYDGAGNVLWAKSAGGTSVDYSTSIAIDGQGNAYITGDFNVSTISFGSITLSNAGGTDIFIAKYDSSGNVLWAKSAGGTGFDEGIDLAVDSSNVYITGEFSSTVSFGSTLLTSSGNTDVFLAKCDTSGNVIWAKKAGGSSQDEPTGIKLDLDGNIFLTGLFASTSINLGSNTLINADAINYTYDIFIAKYDSSGNTLWARREGGISDDGALAISLDGNANIFITGWFSSPTVTFGSTTLSLGSTYSDIFVTKFDSSGNPIWAKRAGGSYGQTGYGISTDYNGNVYATGVFQSDTCSFGSINLINAGNTGNEDIFVAKYDPVGNVLWAISAGGPPQDVSVDICINSIGNAFITGYFWSSTISFGSTTLINSGPPVAGDMFVAKLDYVTDVSDNSNKDAFKVFPNPSSSLVTLFSKELNSVVQIYNAFGEIVFQKVMNTEQMQINVQDLLSGIYFIKIHGKKTERVAKLVKQ